MEELLKKFGKRSGFGVTGFALDEITGYLNESVPDDNVRINVPYNGFNVRGKVSDVHRDVHGVMPSTYLRGHLDEVVDEGDTTTLYYGERRTGRGFYLPFLSECDVYFVSSAERHADGTLVIDLVEGPNWRMYL